MKLTRKLRTTSGVALALLAAPAMAGEVAGVVSDDSDTIALQAASVRLVELGREAVTGRDGSFRFDDVPAGTYTIEAHYVGAATGSQSITVPETGAVRADFALAGVNEAAILVVGQSASQASALSRKRSSDVISDGLTRDAIGQFPDQNVAESLRRLPGVNVLNDQGEGRFVSVRGLDPELNATSLNGVRVPAPESDVRSVALDVISSDIIESIEVNKSLTPDMDADTIGASIEIHTTSAFARRRDLFTAKIEGSYNNYAGNVTPKGSVDFATRLSENVGVSGGLSYYLRQFETDNIEADDWDEGDSGPYAETLEYRDYDVERERISASLNFDFRVGDHTTLFARGLYSQFDDQEYRRRTTFDLGDAFVTGGGDAARFADLDPLDVDEEYAITVERDLKDRFERQKIQSASVGGETDTGGWHAEYSAAWSKASEREHDSLDPVAFEREFESEGLILGIDYSDPRIPLYSVVSDPGAFFDPTEYELNDLSLTTLSNSQDEEWAGRVDLGRSFAMASGEFTVQGGAKGRWRDKSYDGNFEYYENDDFILADVPGDQTYRLFLIEPVASKRGPRQYFDANFGAFELQEADTLFDSAVEDYSVAEDVLAGYLLGRWDTDTLRVIGGMRFEHTSNQMTGNDVLLVEEDGTLPDGSVASDDTVIVTPVVYDRDYGDWLPSLNLRWQAQDDIVLRLAGYRSLVRPKLSALAPRFVVEQNDDDEREGQFGNPDLLPYEAWNFDASAEYYMSSNGALTGAFFYKDVKNFIAEIELEGPGTYRGIAFDDATTFINGDSGKIWGFEVGFSQALTMLPGALGGFVVQANYTYTDATGTVPTDGDPTNPRDVPLPASSKNTFNLALGYDKGPFDVRLSGTYRDGYLDELGSSAEEDRYVDDHFQLDLSAKVRVSQQAQLIYEWVNINNAKYFAYNTVGGRRNLLQFEQYSWTMLFGARINF